MVALLPASVRATLQGYVAAASLPDICTIVRTPQVDDEAGGWTPSDTPTRIGPLPCRYRRWSTTEGRRGAGEQIAAEATSSVTFAAGTDLLDTDQIEVQVAGEALLEVEVVAVRRSSLAVARIAECQELHPT